MFFFYNENLSILFVKRDIIRNLTNKEKKNKDIEDEIETNKDDKIIYKSLYRLFYLMSLSILKCLKRYTKM